jgi:glucose-6-phosphate isomerase
MALSKKNPTIQKSWSSLKDLYNQENNLHINDYFNSEENRLENFTASLNDLYIDFSKNRISKKAFDLLIELCEETDLKGNIDKYFNGSVINETENRSVLHTALRSKNSDSTKISEEVKDTLSKIRTISDEINSGVRLGHSGKKIENVVNIGIGGSHLGPEMVTEALSFFTQGIKPYFISNIDPDYTENIELSQSRYNYFYHCF